MGLLDAIGTGLGEIGTAVGEAAQSVGSYAYEIGSTIFNEFNALFDTAATSGDGSGLTSWAASAAPSVSAASDAVAAGNALGGADSSSLLGNVFEGVKAGANYLKENPRFTATAAGMVVNAYRDKSQREQLKKQLAQRERESKRAAFRYDTPYGGARL